MGVPKFYRWLSERYPQINQILSGTTILPDFDNFYLDMNGIIHACTHPNDDHSHNSLTQREMMMAIFRYIDHMVTEIVKPKKILFMAIDGVAPRAKLNQQRARRFRSAQDREESIIKARQKGEVIDEDALFDSNCITPGTEFMELVGRHLRYFIRKKVKEDALWRNLTIVFSGHEVPGEGEHKIMQFIRDLRADPHYEPNQRHCMYGQDADLIMLGLATHEPHFALLREIVNFNVGFRGGSNSTRNTVMKQTQDAKFQLLHVSLLREYISLDFGYSCSWLPDPERLIDDFILLTFLVGNDFLPHLPTLDISEHAFDVLIDGYRSLMEQSQGYIVQNGELHDLERLEKLFRIVGEKESEILKAREDNEKIFNKKKRRFNDADVATEEELEEAEEARQLLFEAALQEAMGAGLTAASATGAAADYEDLNAATDEDEEEEEEGFDYGAGGKKQFLRKLRAQQAGDQWEEVATRSKLAAAQKLAAAVGGGSSSGESAAEEEAGGLVITKDYRGRYYYEKLQIIADSTSGAAFLAQLRVDYLRGLMWCLAYYVKGCISWTWYYPHHYGPMLIDMTDLPAVSERIEFSLGQPFLPFQQLLGCLPPASAKLLPRPYQWLMTSEDSPVRDFYPTDFGVDQDGKKNPWEAVVLLDFIDERRLVAAEAKHCPVTKLTRSEVARNVFGSVQTFLYEPGCVETYLSCNPEIGLPDIHCCQSIMKESFPSLSPGRFFTAALIPGTAVPIAGFPSLTILPLKSVRTEAAKVNMFGSNSKYQSLILELNPPSVENLSNLKAEMLLDRVIYVNYPQVHEARVVAVTTERETVRLLEETENAAPKNSTAALAASAIPGKSKSKPKAAPAAVAGIEEVNGKQVQRLLHDAYQSERWREESEEETTKYLVGRGTPGSGGLDIGAVIVRLRVRPLQGLQRDPVTGASKKIYSTKAEADIPIQMALWNPPVKDTRFEEVAELPVEQLMPFGSEVIALVGQLQGCKGTVVGPHGPDSHKTNARSLKDDTGGSSTSSQPRVVDIELLLTPPEPPFGYAIADSVRDEYYSSRDLCALLQVSPSVLGKVIGMLRVEPGRHDLGLNLKRNGFYQLIGYVERVEPSQQQQQQQGGATKQPRRTWGSVDSVEIVGMVSEENDVAEKAAEADGSYWQYTARAAALLFDYKNTFPVLFERLQKLPHQPVYHADELLGANGEKKAELIEEWMKAQPFFKLPRTPFTTTALSRDAMAAIERAADVHVSARKASSEQAVVVVRGVPVESLFCSVHRQVGDVALPYNALEPRLGDRVVNLTCAGVPFGFKGTVVTIHISTKYVELIFDEEFMGGKGLQGSCSQFRGKLCRWSDLLLVSRQNEFRDFKKKSKASTSARSYSQAAGTVLPPAVAPEALSHTTATAADSSKKLLSILKRPAAVTTAAAAPRSSSSQPSAGKMKATQSLKDQFGIVKDPNATKLTTIATAEADAVTSGESSNDERGDGDAEDDCDVPFAASNGTGKLVLAEAAGFTADDDVSLLPPQSSIFSQNPLLGVISYEAIPFTALVSAPAKENPTSAVKAYELQSSRQQHQQQRSRPPAAAAAGGRLVLNKDATRRIVKHELKSNEAVASKKRLPAADGKRQPAAAEPNKPAASKSITALLTAANNKRLNSGLAGDASTATAAATSIPSGATAESVAATATADSAATNEAPQSANSAKLLSILKRSAPATQQKEPAVATATVTVSTAPEAPAAVAAPSGNSDIASKLAAAKKAMKEKQQQQQQKPESKAKTAVQPPLPPAAEVTKTTTASAAEQKITVTTSPPFPSAPATATTAASATAASTPSAAAATASIKAPTAATSAETMKKSTALVPTRILLGKTKK